jgi:phosphopantothenoylcysteine decarboxylase/phosphopantothenate--cysteine ligase
MPPLQLVENPDILATISKLPESRPALVIGFAAETENLIENAKAKLARKGCDWIVANDVSPALGVMGGDRNTVHLLTQDANGVRDANGVGDANSIRDGNGVGVDIKIESWPVMTKEEVASTLVARIASQVEKKL